MGLYSAVLGILPLCVYVQVQNASCVWFYNEVLEYTTLSENLKNWNEFTDSNIRKIIITQQNVIVLLHTYNLFKSFLSAQIHC